MCREDTAFFLCFSIFSLAVGSSLYASHDDTTLTAFAVNQTVYPLSFECTHALIYSKDCSSPRRRLHSHSSHSSHSSSGGGSSGASHVTHASTSSKRTIVAGSVFYIYMTGHWEDKQAVQFQSDMQFCGELFDVVNNTISFGGAFVVHCDHDKVGFWKPFAIAVLSLFLFWMLIGGCCDVVHRDRTLL